MGASNILTSILVAAVALLVVFFGYRLRTDVHTVAGLCLAPFAEHLHPLTFSQKIRIAFRAPLDGFIYIFLCFPRWSTRQLIFTTLVTTTIAEFAGYSRMAWSDTRQAMRYAVQLLMGIVDDTELEEDLVDDMYDHFCNWWGAE